MSTLKIASTAALLLSPACAYDHERRQNTAQVVIPGASSYNGLNLVPQMGWNNWNAFRKNSMDAKYIHGTTTKVIF